MRSRLLAVLAAGLAVAVLGTSCAHRYRPKGPQVKYEGFYSTFPTGLRLVVYETPQVDRFMLSVSYRGGAVDDPAGKEGLAHLTEHLAFRARPAPAAPRLWDQLLATGWAFNAFTSHDETVYWEMGKPADLGQALALEAARMRDPLAGVSEDDLAVERDVVISEYRERFETDPLGAEIQFLLAAAFPDGHSYGRAVAGTPDSLRQIGLADVRRFTGERYGASGAVVVIASPLPARQTVELAVGAFGKLATGAPGKPAEYQPPGLPTPPGTEAPMVQRSAPVSAPHLWVAWPVPGFYSRRTPQAYAAAEALETLLRGRLARDVYDLHVRGITTGVLTLDGAALVYARIELQAPGYAARALEMAKDAAFGLSGRGSTDTAIRLGAIDQVRERLLVDAYLDLESLDTPNVARFVRATGNPDYIGYWPKIVALQLNADTNSYAYEFLRRDRAAAVLVVPDGTAAPRRAGVPAPGRQGDSVDELEDEGGHPPPGPAQALAVARPPGLDRAERRVLENGLEVLVARRGSLPVAEIRLVVRTDPTGSPAVPDGLPGLALRGGDASFYQWWGQAQAGTSRWTGLGRESVLFRARGTSANLDVLLEGTAEWIRNRRIDYFDDRKRFAGAAIERASRDPAVRAFWALQERLFPGHPYGSHPDAAAVGRIPERDADRWLDAQFRPERSTLVVVSDIAPSPEMWGWIEGQFGRWRTGSAQPAPAARPAPAPSRRVAVLDRPGATQALILVGLQTPPPAMRDEAAFRALRWVLTDRLQRRIRVEEGLSYGVRVGLVDQRAAGGLVIGAAVDADGAARSLAYVLECTAALGSAPVTADQVARARWQVARRFGLSFDTVDEAADALQSASLLGLGLDHHEKLPASIAALDAARIQAAAKALGVGREVVVVVGDKEALLPQLRKAGLEPEVIEAPR